jgi:hypothetical protein
LATEIRWIAATSAGASGTALPWTDDWPTVAYTDEVTVTDMDRVEPTFREFLIDLRRILGANLADVVIHGSYALGDFRPGCGDLDYMVVTHRDLDEATNSELFALHDQYRSEKRLLLHQLEGTFFPTRVALDPRTPFVGCYIGTTRRGWRTVTTFQNSFIELEVVRQRGRHLLAPAVPFYVPDTDQIIVEQRNDHRKLTSATQQATSPTPGLWISAVHWCARTICYLDEGEITSKGAACRRCQDFPGLRQFVHLLQLAQDRRYPYGDEPLDANDIERCRRLLEYAGRRLAARPLRVETDKDAAV